MITVENILRRIKRRLSTLETLRKTETSKGMRNQYCGETKALLSLKEYIEHS